MTDEPADVILTPQVNALHGALMQGGMTTEQADHVVAAVKELVDFAIGDHVLKEHVNVPPAAPRARKAKAKKRKKSKR